MSHIDRKTQKKRGSRTHGYGNTQKHRGAGSRGGRGLGGGKKQKWMWVSKFMPDHFGGKGFKRPPEMIASPNTINVGDLEAKLSSWVSEGVAEKKSKRYYIDLSKAGFQKLLGSGRISSPIDVAVARCSEKAKNKLEEAGGSVVLLEQSESESEPAAESAKSS